MATGTAGPGCEASLRAARYVLTVAEIPVAYDARSGLSSQAFLQMHQGLLFALFSGQEIGHLSSSLSKIRSHGAEKHWQDAMLCPAVKCMHLDPQHD